MTWTIRDLVLPIEPSEIRKRTIRIQQPIPVSGDFPSPSINQPGKFELQIKGKIWPRQLAQQLDEATKNAETEELVIFVPDEDNDNQWLSGDYSVTRAEFSRKKPVYTEEDGVAVEVYDYNITFLKYADTGSEQESDEGGPSEDEETGFFDIQTLGFDKNGDGDIDLDDIFNWFNSIMTFGAVG